MKKYLILLTLMLLAFSSSYSEIIPENYGEDIEIEDITLPDSTIKKVIKIKKDWTKKGLKGRVKTVVNTRYEYDEESGKLEKTWVTTTDFNRQGYIKREVQYVNGRLNRGVVSYEHNKEGLPVKRIEEGKVKNVPMFKPDEDKIFIYKYKETKDGNLVVTIKREGSSSMEKITYDKNGREIYEERDGILRQVYTYNEKGDLIETKDNECPKCTFEVSYNYYTNGDYERITDIPGSRWIYLYDKNGKVKEYVEIDKIGTTGVDKVVMYLKYKDITRDEYGNLTSKTSILYDYSTQKKIGIHEKIENTYEYYE